MREIDVLIDTDKIDTLEKSVSDIQTDLNVTENSKYSTINGIKEFDCGNGYVDNIVIEGQTLVNICKKFTDDWILNGGLSYYRASYLEIIPSLKPNTTYTIKMFGEGANIHSFVLDGCFNTVKGNYGVITTFSTLKDNGYFHVYSNTSIEQQEVKGIQFLLVEGIFTKEDMSNYFEGLKSVGQGDKIEVLSYNGESFDYGTLTFTNGIKLPTTGVHTDNNDWKYSNYIKVNPNTGYLLKYVSVNINFYDTNKNIIPSDYQKFLVENVGDTSIGHIYIKTPSNCEYIIIHRRHINTSPIEIYKVSQYDKKQILTTSRGLPDGLKDIVYKQGDKYYKIKRCGEYILDENFVQVGVSSDTSPIININSNFIGFGFDISDINIDKKYNMYTDKMEVSSDIQKDWTNATKECFVAHKSFSSNYLNRIGLVLSKSKNLNTYGDIRNYLKTNPITIVYELATPIIEELPNFNPRCFSDKSTILINSGVVQCDASFEVTNSMRSELEVLKGKVSDLDNEYDEIYYPTLLNGWVNFDNNQLRLTKSGNTVILQGFIKNPSIPLDGSVLFTLPSKFTPKSYVDSYGCMTINNKLLGIAFGGGFNLVKVWETSNYTANYRLKIYITYSLI